MKIALRWFAYSSLGLALVTGAVAQDLRLKGQPTLAAPRSTVELRTGPTYSAQKHSPTTTAPTSTYSAPSTTAAPATTLPTAAAPASKWAPVPAAAPLASAPSVAPSASADPVSTPCPDASPVRLSVGTLSPTPEMWFYEQMRQDANNPELIVRRRAEQAAADRKARIASRAWYGVSLSRPRANVTPFTYHYSPTWTSNPYHPFSWTAPRVAAPVVIEARRPYVGVSGFGAW
jgi:hypothetical protein